MFNYLSAAAAVVCKTSFAALLLSLLRRCASCKSFCKRDPSPLAHSGAFSCRSIHLASPGISFLPLILGLLADHLLPLPPLLSSILPTSSCPFRRARVRCEHKKPQFCVTGNGLKIGRQRRPSRYRSCCSILETDGRRTDDGPTWKYPAAAAAAPPPQPRRWSISSPSLHTDRPSFHCCPSSQCSPKD